MEKTVSVIAAEIEAEQPCRLKVAAYCRVSTEHREQVSSPKAQATLFTNLINDNPGWEFAGIYAEQELGTKTENRDELKRMFADCESGKINLILTKFMSRDDRNTLDMLRLLDRLLKSDIEVQFKLEGIHIRDIRVMETIADAATFYQRR